VSEEIQREQEIFEQALARPAGESRDAYLTDACGTDQPLRREIEELLNAHAAANGFIPKRAASDMVAGWSGTDLTEGPGSIIGRYKLLEKIG
jgi:hypothetical protein